MPPAEDRIELVQALARVESAVRAYAYAILRDFHLAEDVGQEVALLAAGRWEALPRGEAFLAWARETARRKALDHIRKAAASRRRDRTFAAALSEETWEALAPRFRPPDADSVAALRECLDRLPPHAHAAVLARYGANRSCEEIAVQVGRSIQGLYAILKRARLALVACVDRRVAALSREETP